MQLRISSQAVKGAMNAAVAVGLFLGGCGLMVLGSRTPSDDMLDLLGIGAVIGGLCFAANACHFDWPAQK